jgi:hypothetical protein
VRALSREVLPFFGSRLRSCSRLAWIWTIRRRWGTWWREWRVRVREVCTVRRDTGIHQGDRPDGFLRSSPIVVVHRNRTGPPPTGRLLVAAMDPVADPQFAISSSSSSQATPECVPLFALPLCLCTARALAPALVWCDRTVHPRVWEKEWSVGGKVRRVWAARRVPGSLRCAQDDGVGRASESVGSLGGALLGPMRTRNGWRVVLTGKSAWRMLPRDM